jgi:hypothetical protein
MIAPVELKYIFGLEFGFYMYMFFGERLAFIGIFLHEGFIGYGLRIGFLLAWG